MMNTWALSALWVGLALAATLLAIWFKVSTALSEIVVGPVAQLVIGVFLAQGGLAGNTQWITFLAGTGAIVPTFLASAEIERIAKYNRLLQIEWDLGAKARYAGASIYEHWNKPVSA